MLQVPPTATPYSDPWLGRDKLQHFLACAGTALGVYLLLLLSLGAWLDTSDCKAAAARVCTWGHGGARRQGVVLASAFAAGEES